MGTRCEGWQVEAGVSNSIFPQLPGESWPTKRKPRFSTIASTASSGQQVRIPNYPFPLTEFEVPINVMNLTQGELDDLWGFYVARIGAWDSFLFYDPSDNYTIQNASNVGLSPTSGQNFIPGANGILPAGDGSTKAFQLYRTKGRAMQPVFDINGITATLSPPIASPYATVYVNGNAVSQSGNWTISNTGLLTFTSAPPDYATVAVDFSYFWRVHFADDDLEFSEFCLNLFEAQSVKFNQTYS